jgi:hypothetical protein
MSVFSSVSGDVDNPVEPGLCGSNFFAILKLVVSGTKVVMILVVFLNSYLHATIRFYCLG